MQTEIAPVSPARSPGSHAPPAAPEDRPQSPLRRLRAALRFDGLWWRKLARLGSVYGPEWWKRGCAAGRRAHHLPRRRPQSAGRDRESGARAAGRAALERRRRRLSDVRVLRATAWRRPWSTTVRAPKRFRIDEPARNHVARGARARPRRDPCDGPRRQLGHLGEGASRDRATRASGDGPRAQRNDAGIFALASASRRECT